MAVVNSNLRKLVHTILRTYPESRDCDRWLTVYVWYNEKKTSDLDEFLRNYIKGEYHNHDSITRARRDLQKKYPELRGTTYEKRQEKLEPEARKEFKPN